MILYVITRSDLPASYRGVQAAHALAEIVHSDCDTITEWITHHKTLVFLALRDENELREFMNNAEKQGFYCAPFYETDLGDELTAVAFAPMSVEEAREIIPEEMPLA